jgi:hypothetical protein
MKTPVGKTSAARAFQLEIAGGVAQETEKLVTGYKELKRSRMKLTLHDQWIAQIAPMRHRIPRIAEKVFATAVRFCNTLHPSARFVLRPNAQRGQPV